MLSLEASFRKLFEANTVSKCTYECQIQLLVLLDINYNCSKNSNTLEIWLLINNVTSQYRTVCYARIFNLFAFEFKAKVLQLTFGYNLQETVPTCRQAGLVGQRVLGDFA